MLQPENINCAHAEKKYEFEVFSPSKKNVLKVQKLNIKNKLMQIKKNSKN